MRAVRRTPFWAIVALTPALISFAADAEASGAVQRREVGTLVLENIPEAGPDIRASMDRYQHTRSASFQCWLDDGSMLIKTRFGQTSQLHRVASPGAARTQITFFDEPVRGATGSPRGERFVFSKDEGGSERYQGYLRSVDGRAVQITDAATRNQGFVFSRDGAMVAWTRATPGSANWDILLMRAEDPSSRRVVFGGHGIMAPLDFSPDGTMLLLHNYISATSSGRYVLDLKTGQARQLNPSSEEILYTGGKFTEDGSAVLVLSDQGSEFLRLVRFDLNTDKMSVLSPPDLRWDVETYDLVGMRAFDISNDGRRLAYSINDDGRSRVILLDLETHTALPAPDIGNATLDGLEFSPDGARIAMTIATASADSDVWTWSIDDRRLERWTFSEMGGLDPENLPQVDLIRVSSFDGLSIPAFVYRPARPQPGKAPVILWFHGGPAAQMRPAFVAKASYLVNELGAVVIFPNVRGSTGYGKTFSKLDDGRKREDSVKDVEAILDWIKTRSDLDATRVVAYGGSYGGYMALASLAYYSDRLVGAIDEVGISNWSTFLANTEGYRRDARRTEYGDEREADMQAFFDRISPLNMTERMTRPLLVIQGANDPRVPQSESEQIVAGLRKRGVEVWYLLAKDEGHGFRKRQSQDAQWEAETLFLRKVFRLDPAGTSSSP